MKLINSDSKTVSKLIEINKVLNDFKANDFKSNNFKLDNFVIKFKTDISVINFKTNNSVVKFLSTISSVNRLNVSKLEFANELNDFFKNYNKN